MKKLIFPALVFALVAFVGCLEETGTVVGGDDSSEAEDSSSEAESSNSSEKGDSGSSSAGNTGTTGTIECGDDFSGKEGSDGSTQDGKLLLDLSIFPTFFPDGDWDEGYAMPNVVDSDGCDNDDGDCEFEISYDDCGRFEDKTGTPEEQYFGASFLNKTSWNNTMEWGDTEPTKLVGEFAGNGKMTLVSFGGEEELTLTDEYQELVIELDFDKYNTAAAKDANNPNTDYEDEGLFAAPAGIGVAQNDLDDEDEVIWVRVKNLRFEK